jgi:type II secretory pathway pseudopilin PulG
MLGSSPRSISHKMKMTSLKWALVLSGGFVVMGGLIWLFLPNRGPSLRRARESVLQQDLFELRALVRQYALDKQERPHSLHELVVAGYLKEIPRDPMTGRNDSWVVTCSSDLSSKGIVGVESGREKSPSTWNLRCD